MRGEWMTGSRTRPALRQRSEPGDDDHPQHRTAQRTRASPRHRVGAVRPPADPDPANDAKTPGPWDLTGPTPSWMTGNYPTALRTEAGLLRTLARGCYTLPELYQLAERAGLADRSGGRRIIQDGQEQYKRRVRSALQALKRHGRARQAGTGRAAWLIEGTTERPRRALLVWLPSEPSQVELVLGAAATVLGQAGEPIDLIVADPPRALGRAASTSAYRHLRA